MSSSATASIGNNPFREAGPVTLRDLADPALPASVEDLQLVSQWVVEGFLHGLHRSPYVGFSVDFASHREYMPGDDLRHLNWKLFGRHDRLYIKQYDAETNVDLHIVLDLSASMTVGEAGQHKLRYASILAASLAFLAQRQRDAVGLTLIADRVLAHFQARNNTDHMLSLFSALAQPRKYVRVDSPQVLHEAAELMPRRGIVAVISDFYYDEEQLLGALDHFRHFGHDVLIFQVLAPVERRLPIDGAIRLIDAETGESLETIGHEIRTSFTAAVDAWLERLHTACLARDIDHLALSTDDRLDRGLLDYFFKRAAR
jgi:uncharacterized protein (DUF58 family)